ncbi:hypothetical protein P343_18235 [Sporolactobacillus laevolacticus DSM 442]|uniref:Uncharacterized protein n=1 Tax=Sporolactobacillus laevolacticus DSM 442 TaxID=1395513 RepID=V6IUY7_9BACL|nr:hypothetical protein P343_18235 [Sporolactobacillus laevolacticus DSM 442]
MQQDDDTETLMRWVDIRNYVIDQAQKEIPYKTWIRLIQPSPKQTIKRVGIKHIMMNHGY